jgi:hypothetical protein
LLLSGTRLYGFFNRLTDETRKSVLIVDDSPYDRSRSKMVELLSRVWDHSSGRFLMGFRMLTLCWSDGASCLTMDSWFTMPATVAALTEDIDVIGMVKKTPKIHYGYNGHHMDLMAIYSNLKKRRGRAKILASTIVELKDGPRVKLVFVRDRRKKDWLVLMCTDLELANEDIVRIYGKRWDIEVFFKMAKQHLKLTKEIQFRDYDALIAHTSIVFMRNMFLAYQCRIEIDHRTFGELFYSCCEQMTDISFIEALYRILTSSGQRLRETISYCEKTASAIFDTIIETALQCVGLSKNNGMTVAV